VTQINNTTTAAPVLNWCALGFAALKIKIKIKIPKMIFGSSVYNAVLRCNLDIDEDGTEFEELQSYRDSLGADKETFAYFEENARRPARMDLVKSGYARKPSPEIFALAESGDSEALFEFGGRCMFPLLYSIDKQYWGPRFIRESIREGHPGAMSLYVVLVRSGTRKKASKLHKEYLKNNPDVFERVAHGKRVMI
jgi:hypothetical protein